MQKLKLFILLAIIMVSFNSFAQPINAAINDPVRNREVLVDLLDRNGLASGEMGEFFTIDYEAYQPDTAVIDALKPLLEDIHITIVLGTWCGDSKEQLPRFMKVLDLTGFNQENLLMIGVDSHKKAREIDVDVFAIEKVPTFIFTRNERELGRIIETPLDNLEKDLLVILNNAESDD
ncbi:MAG: thioredoxin [Bacteroidetes bacterium HGW-Bacteroidetes-1]|jgi:thiol-disulfide isomerase/thioredoxin|nr:MAG: thioredoxin [Bacteroidetes bacterium HGW-Bacteroidetes-1]